MRKVREAREVEGEDARGERVRKRRKRRGRRYLGEEGLLPVLAAGLVDGLEAVVLAGRLVRVDRAHQDGDIPAHQLDYHVLQQAVHTHGTLHTGHPVNFTVHIAHYTECCTHNPW